MDTLISHHTGITMLTLFPQMSASTPYVILAIKSQKEMESVATFPARQCQGRTMSTEIAEKKATGANSGCMTVVKEGLEQRKIHGYSVRVFERHWTESVSVCVYCRQRWSRSMDNGFCPFLFGRSIHYVKSTYPSS